MIKIMNPMLAKSFALGAIIAIAVVGSVISGELVVAQQGSSYGCPAAMAAIINSSGSGFLMNEQIGKSQSVQYVITPSSSANLTINYYLGSYTAQHILDNSSDYFHPVESWAQVGSKSASPLSPSDVGLFATPNGESTTGNRTLTASYELTTLSSALKGAYVGYFWSNCPPQIVITVGNSLYAGPGLNEGLYF